MNLYYCGPCEQERRDTDRELFEHARRHGFPPEFTDERGVYIGWPRPLDAITADEVLDLELMAITGWTYEFKRTLETRNVMA